MLCAGTSIVMLSMICNGFVQSVDSPTRNHQDLDEYKDMLYYFGCIYHSFKDLTNIEKWTFISNLKDLQASYFLSRFVGKAFQARKSLFKELLV